MCSPVLTLKYWTRVYCQINLSFPSPFPSLVQPLFPLLQFPFLPGPTQFTLPFPFVVCSDLSYPFFPLLFVVIACLTLLTPSSPYLFQPFLPSSIRSLRPLPEICVIPFIQNWEKHSTNNAIEAKLFHDFVYPTLIDSVSSGPLV